MILNLLNGKRYIGSAVNLKTRRQDHFSALRKENHDNSHLQRAFCKYGRNVFGWEVLEYIEDLGTLILWENLYLSMYWPTGLLYNKCPVAGSSLGCRWKCSKETGRRRSRAALKRWGNPEFCRRMREINGRVKSRLKRNKAQIKRWRDPKQHEMASKAHLKNWEDPERRRRASEMHAGERNHNYGNHRSYDELYGPERAAELRQKMSERMKKWWAQRKRDQAATQGNS